MCTRANRNRGSIDLDPAYVNRILGAEIPVEEMVRILEALEFRVDKETGKQGNKEEPLVYLSTCLLVSVPSHRQDITIPADLAEEIGRIYGYDRLTPTLLEDELPPQRRNAALEGEDKVRDILAGAGLEEVITYSMIDVRTKPGSSRGEVASPVASSPAGFGGPGRGNPAPTVRHRASTRSLRTAATCAGRCCRAC